MSQIGDSTYNYPKDYVNSPQHQHVITLLKLSRAEERAERPAALTILIKQIAKKILLEKPENFSVGDQILLKNFFFNISDKKLFAGESSTELKMGEYHTKLVALLRSAYKKDQP